MKTQQSRIPHPRHYSDTKDRLPRKIYLANVCVVDSSFTSYMEKTITWGFKERHFNYPHLFACVWDTPLSRNYGPPR